MSRNYHQLDSSNPFYCEDDENGTADELQQINAKIRKSENRQVQSLGRVQRILNETEEVGYKTAEELLHQGEQLQNTEEKLDSIDAMTKVTQSHITSIKSVFGSLKNKMFGRKTEEQPVANKTEIQHSRLRETMDEEFGVSGTRSGGGAGVDSDSDLSRYRGTPTSSQSQSHSTQYSKYKNSSSRFTNSDLSDDSEDEGYDMLRDTSQTSSKQAIMDDQLNDISTSLHRLKHLGRGMNDELKKQDEGLGRLMEKTERNGMVLDKQNKQMRKLLQ